MLDKQLREEICTHTQTFWDQEVKQPKFVELAASKKEFGHSAANSVDKVTADFLSRRYDIYFQHGKDNTERSRSMGDLWIRENGVSHPINIKTGKVSVGTGKIKWGQPNMTAMVKLLNALLAEQIDSYYLLIIKFAMSETESVPITPTVYFVDMLDYLGCMTFDAGPGQIMMREKAFYDAVAGAYPPASSTETKIAKLLEMYPDGVERLRNNRLATLSNLQDKHNDYKGRSVHSLDQSGLKLQKAKSTDLK